MRARTQPPRTPERVADGVTQCLIGRERLHHVQASVDVRGADQWLLEPDLQVRVSSRVNIAARGARLKAPGCRLETSRGA